jgi:hypothetical protein
MAIKMLKKSVFKTSNNKKMKYKIGYSSLATISMDLSLI